MQEKDDKDERQKKQVKSLIEKIFPHSMAEAARVGGDIYIYIIYTFFSFDGAGV